MNDVSNNEPIEIIVNNINIINSKVDIDDNGDLIFECPHCKSQVLVSKGNVNCGIFRHAQYKNNRQQVPPHAPKELCDTLINNDLVFGCCKPFKLSNKTLQKEWIVEICEYI